jgi:hypothetical protein
MSELGKLDSLGSLSSLENLGTSDRKLVTKGSNLKKFFDVLNAPNAVKNSIILDVYEAISLKKQRTGSDVVKALFGSSGDEAGKIERASTGTAGFLFDVFTDPIGAIVKPLKLISKGAKSGSSFASQLAKNERALVSVFGVNTPKIVNELTG